MLENHQVLLLKDIALLDKMYEQNLVYFKELSMYILAGKKKLEEEENEVIPALRKKAELSGRQEDAQEVNDREALCNRFDKKIHDLELTRTISENVGIPVIASGGAGTKEHFYDAFAKGKADSALAASLFHFKELEIADLKNYLSEKNIPMRL